MRVFFYFLGVGFGGKEDIFDFECRKQDVENSFFLDFTVLEVFFLSFFLFVIVVLVYFRKELFIFFFLVEYLKLFRSVFIFFVIVQKIFEKLVGNEVFSFIFFSKEGRFGEWRILVFGVFRNGDYLLWYRFTIQFVFKIYRFFSNISVINSSGKEFNKIISKVVVNVQERKVQVLVNINGIFFFIVGEMEDQVLKGYFIEQRRSIFLEQGIRDQSKLGFGQEVVFSRAGRQISGQQFRGVQIEQFSSLVNGFQSIYDVLKREFSVFVFIGKIVIIYLDSVFISKFVRQNVSKSLYEYRQSDCSQDARRRSGSFFRVVGFRSQGIIVQFFGRGFIEEVRREVLRKFGFLKENL